MWKVTHRELLHVGVSNARSCGRTTSRSLPHSSRFVEDVGSCLDRDQSDSVHSNFSQTFFTTSSSDWLVLPPPSAMDMRTGSAFFFWTHHSSAVTAGMSAWVSG